MRKIVFKMFFFTAVALISAVGIYLGFFRGQTQTTYADTMDYKDMMFSAPKDKVEIMFDEDKYSAETCLRLIVIAYNMNENYKDIYNQKYDGCSLEEMFVDYFTFAEKSTDLDLISKRWTEIQQIVQNINALVSDEEKNWLESLGATDIVIQTPSIFVCSMKVSDLAGLSSGKCNYRVLMASADFERNALDDIANYFGEYKCEELSFMPLISSSIGGDAQNKNEKLVMSDKGFIITTDQEIVSMQILEPTYKVKDKMILQDIFSSFNMISMSKELLYTLINSNMVVDVMNKEKGIRIFLCGDAIYVDQGLQGLYKYVKVN